MIYNGMELRDIPGFSKYMVTEDGQIFRKEHSVPQRSKTYLDGTHTVNQITKSFRQCNPTKNKITRYMQCSVSNDKCKISTLYIHRAVASAFCIRPEGCTQVDHMDGCRTNNHSSNLEWVTAHENMRRVFTRKVAGESNER